MKEIDSKMLNEVRNNPIAQVLFGAMGITDKELDKLDEELKKKESSEVEEQSECENSSCDNLKKNNNEYNSTLTKEEVLAILKEWESVEKSQHARHEYITGKKRCDRHTRDILLNSSFLGWEKTAEFIIELVKRKNMIDDNDVIKGS